jgi:hypothetical protein
VNTSSQKIPLRDEGIDRGASVQHYHKELESSHEVDFLLEDQSECDLQCGESLAIAANRRMDEGCSLVERFGVWILREFRERGRCSLL